MKIIIALFVIFVGIILLYLDQKGSKVIKNFIASLVMALGIGFLIYEPVVNLFNIPEEKPKVSFEVAKNDSARVFTDEDVKQTKRKKGSFMEAIEDSSKKYVAYLLSTYSIDFYIKNLTKNTENVTLNNEFIFDVSWRKPQGIYAIDLSGETGGGGEMSSEFTPIKLKKSSQSYKARSYLINPENGKRYGFIEIKKELTEKYIMRLECVQPGIYSLHVKFKYTTPSQNLQDFTIKLDKSIYCPAVKDVYTIQNGKLIRAP